MKKESIKAAQLQGGDEKEGHLHFQEYMRSCIREALWGLMQQEVGHLCGPKYHPNEASDYVRAGSELGRIHLGDGPREIRRPRVRRKGRNEEVQLKSYRQARKHRKIEMEVQEALVEGMSTRGFSRIGVRGVSRSAASRQWVSRSVQCIQKLRGRSLHEELVFGLIIDGIFLAKEIAVIVCIGLCLDGRKIVLDFEVGSSESYEGCHRLLHRLRERGLRMEGQLLGILDGAAALEKAFLEFCPHGHVQRCLIHKERNLHSYLRRSDHAECSRLMGRLRKAQGETAGREALKALENFVGSRNHEALQSLKEAGEKLITVHRLNAPATLHASLLSTNLIENVMRNFRRQTERVCRWRTQTDQVSRWTATALLWAEEGFRKIRGYEDLPILLRTLGISGEAG